MDILFLRAKGKSAVRDFAPLQIHRVTDSEAAVQHQQHQGFQPQRVVLRRVRIACLDDLVGFVGLIVSVIMRAENIFKMGTQSLRCRGRAGFALRKFYGLAHVRGHGFGKG